MGSKIGKEAINVSVKGVLAVLLISAGIVQLSSCGSKPKESEQIRSTPGAVKSAEGTCERSAAEAQVTKYLKNKGYNSVAEAEMVEWKKIGECHFSVKVKITAANRPPAFKMLTVVWTDDSEFLVSGL